MNFVYTPFEIYLLTLPYYIIFYILFSFNVQYIYYNLNVKLLRNIQNRLWYFLSLIFNYFYFTYTSSFLLFLHLCVLSYFPKFIACFRWNLSKFFCTKRIYRFVIFDFHNKRVINLFWKHSILNWVLWIECFELSELNDHIK